MGKKDAVAKEYMRDPDVFADAFNFYLYGGKEVVKPENLQELDATSARALDPGVRLMARDNAQARTGENSRSPLVGGDV